MAKFRIEIDSRELATALAALRYWQNDWMEQSEGPMAGHFHEQTPLTGEEIDELCEKLNFAEPVV
jgi:hypothetical protein